MVALGNPVRGHIYPKGLGPVGAFEVTSTFAQHVASGRGGGIDISDGRCGSDILTMGRFRVAEAFTVTSGPYIGAKIVRYDLLDYPGYQPGIAHMSSIETAVGVTGPEGVVIGHIGGSGGVPCHLHGGMKRNGVEIDWWSLLRQNGATDGDDMIPIPGANYVRLANKRSSLKYNGNFRDERKNGQVLELYPAGTVIYPVAYANDGEIPVGSQSAEWFACILYVKDRGNMLGWFHSSLVNPLQADIPTGYTQADKDAAVLAATTPLLGRIEVMHAKALDIAND